MWKNIVEPGRTQMTIKYGACAVHAGYLRLHTHARTHTQYKILIASPLQQWYQERASMLHCTYTACLIQCNKLNFNIIIIVY